MSINILLGVLISSSFSLVFYMLYIIKKDIYALNQISKNNENFFLQHFKTLEDKFKILEDKFKTLEDKFKNNSNTSLQPFHFKQTLLELEKRVDFQAAKLLLIMKNVKKK